MRRPSQRTQDVLLGVAVAAAILVDMLTGSAVEGPRLLNVLALAPVPVAIVMRRRWPLAAFLVLWASFVVMAAFLTPPTGTASTLPPVLLLAYANGREGSDLRVFGALLLGLIASVDLISGQTSADDFVFAPVLAGAAALAGRGLRTRALVAAGLAERTELLQQQLEAQALHAAQEERRRIARELHDVVAHTLSVMVVQAGGARRTLDRDPARAEEALAVVESTGHAALAELRRLLGLVGETGAAVPHEPQPTLGHLEGLVRRAQDAGLRTSLTIEGEPGSLAAGAEVAVYRIVQEALTNALKHAGAGAHAAVALRWTSAALEVEVRDDGSGDHHAPTSLPSGGHGLVGMRERAALFGGDLAVEPLPGGGFAVRATLPREQVEVPA